MFFMAVVFFVLSDQEEGRNMATLGYYVVIYPLENDLKPTNSCKMGKKQKKRVTVSC